MAAPITERFEQMVLEVSEDGTLFARICGLKDVTVNRTLTLNSTEVPADCDDESLPYSISKEASTFEVTVEAQATWAAQSHGMMMDWIYDGLRKSVRVGHLNAAAGDTEYETGEAYLTSLPDQRTKGNSVTRTITIEFAETPTRSAKA